MISSLLDEAEKAVEVVTLEVNALRLSAAGGTTNFWIIQKEHRMSQMDIPSGL